MKRLIQFTLFTVALLASIAFVGCTEDVAIDPPAIVGGDGARFSFVVDDLDVATEDQEASIGTRVTANEPSAEIKNMWVVQYGAEDAFIDRYYYDPYTDESSLKIDDSASKIVFIANTFESDLVSDKITLDALTKLTTTDVTTTDGTNKYFILSGTYDVTKNGNTVNLSRNVAKVNIAVTSTGLDDSEYTLTDITIYNVAESSLIYTNYNGANFKAKSTTSYKLTSDELIAATGDGATLFLHVNEQGEKTENANSKDKVTNAPTDATYVVLTYTKNFFERKYTFYLGKNMTTDYNILPNYQYNCKFNINAEGNHMTDSRIEAGLAYIPMSTAADIDRWKKKNASNTDAIKNLEIGKTFIDFKYSVGEVRGTNWMSTSAVIEEADPDGDDIVNKNVDSYSITTTTNVSNDVLPRLQGIFGTDAELPTQKELMYMWVFKGSNTFHPLDYWAGMVHSANDSYRWYVDMEYGDSSGVTASNDRSARAVKKIALP